MSDMISPATQRIASLDALRGLGVLGILLMNIQAFAMPMAAYLNPTAFGSLEGLNGVVWGVSHLLADQKMMALFSMLFGAGIVLFCERMQSRGQSPAVFHYRRTFWLLVFGALHGYLLWYGDILFLYAICAFVLYPLRDRTPQSLLLLALGFLAVSSALYILTGLELENIPEEVLAGEVLPVWQPDKQSLNAEIAAYQGGWLSQMGKRLPATVEMHSLTLLLWGFWRAAGMMLLGMALYKTGVLTGQASDRLYRQLLLIGLCAGVPVVAFGMYWNFRNDWALSSMFLGSQFNYWASVPVSLGWMGGLILLLRHQRLRALTDRLAAVGQMALTNYIMQTVLCGLIFYGHGLGWFGQVERAGQFAIVLGIWTLQLLWSPVWLRHFRFGPLEWLWRSLTYWRLQPLRRRPAVN